MARGLIPAILLPRPGPPGGCQRVSFVRPAAAIVGILMLILAAAGLLGSRVTNSIEQLRDSATRASLQVEAAAAVMAILDDAEGSQHNFVLSLRPGALDPYWAARAKLSSALGRLDTLAEGTFWLAPEAAALRSLTVARTAEMDRPIFAARTQGQKAAIEILATDSARAGMDAVRARVAHIVEHANMERDERTAGLVRRERETLIAVSLTALLGVLLLGYATLRLLIGRSRLVTAQADLRQQRQRLQGTVDHVPDGVAVFDAQDRLLLWNPNFFPVTALPDHLAVAGADYSAFVVAAAEWNPPLLAGPRPVGGPAVAETLRGTAVLEIWRSSMPDGGQMLAISDITRRTEAEAIARQTYKMEALGQLTGGVAHDFNNLLQVVSANLDLLSDRLAANGDGWLAERLNAARAGVDRGARLTRHLLAFARRQPLSPEPIDPARLLTSMEDMLRRTLGGTAEIELAVGTALWAVRADPHQLENAILNLAINGRDAMAEPLQIGAGAHRLTVTAANAVLEEADAAQHPEVASGDYVRISVRDTGTGMTEAAITRAVEPFYTTKGEGRGTGLGLSMVYGFVRQSDGHFHIDSEPGQGTTVTLFIPRTETVPQSFVAPPTEIPRGQNELVLVVEDDAAVRTVAAETLVALGFRTIQAANGAEAMALLADGLRPDILFTDVVMPGAPGARELADRARALVPRIAVLFTSGFTEPASRRNIAGAIDGIVHDGEIDRDVQLLGKPWVRHELALRLHDVLTRARRASTPHRQCRVLLVEDEAPIRTIAAELLSAAGYAVRDVATGGEALALIEDGVDVMVADLGLPDMDGMALARAALARLPHLKVVIASGRAADNASADGRIRVLLKPYSATALRQAVAASLDEPVGD